MTTVEFEVTLTVNSAELFSEPIEISDSDRVKEVSLTVMDTTRKFLVRTVKAVAGSVNQYRLSGILKSNGTNLLDGYVEQSSDVVNLRDLCNRTIILYCDECKKKLESEL